MQRAFHPLMDSTAMSHPGLRLLAFASSYSCSQRSRSPVTDFLELRKKGGDDTGDIKQESSCIFLNKFLKYTIKA